MMIDNTFTLLFILSKVGDALLSITIVAALAAVVTAIIFAVRAEAEMYSRSGASKRIWFRRYLRFGKLLFWVIGGSAFFGSLCPDMHQIRTYAEFAITKEVANSEMAQRLTEAVVKYLEGKADEYSNKK